MHYNPVAQSVQNVKRLNRVDSFPPIGGFPPILHGFFTPLRPICRGGGYAFYKHPKLPKNGQKQSFSAPEIHCQNPPC